MKHILAVMPFQERHKAYLQSIAPDCVFTYTTIPEVTPEQVKQADIILGNVSPALVRQAEHLAWMQLNSAGYDPYCGSDIIQPGTILTCATGAYGLAVSEHMFTGTCMLCRKMDLYLRNQIAHNWASAGEVCSLWGSTTLVIGLGDIGREYARRMKAMGSYVIGIRRNLNGKPDYVDELHPMEELDELLGRADFVGMALPSTAATKGLMNEERLLKMKKGSYLINGGRGDAVDCDALNRVLRAGASLAGCALDVTDPEPLPKEHPLWDAPRTIITPHVAGGFSLPETFERIVRITGENLKIFLSGNVQDLRNQVSV